MYGIEIHTAAASLPLEVDGDTGLRARLRLNDQGEDDLLEQFIRSACDRFEADTNRPVIATVYRQYVNRWPTELVLGRGGVTSVASVIAYIAAGVESTVNASTWRAQLKAPPAAIIFPDSTPDASLWHPAGYVQYTAGWANAAAVPAEVVTAIALLAGFFYQNREAFTEADLKALPIGWQSIVGRYKLGLSGDWGQ